MIFYLIILRKEKKMRNEKEKKIRNEKLQMRNERGRERGKRRTKKREED